jgi:REP element-mobilizing transposase RayT
MESDVDMELYKSGSHTIWDCKYHLVVGLYKKCPVLLDKNSQPRQQYNGHLIKYHLQQLRNKEIQLKA